MNWIDFNGNYDGVYWYVMESIGGVLSLPEKTIETIK